MNISKDFLTTGEVAVLFSVSPDTALRWARNGKIPSIRTPGGHYRIYRTQLLSLISEKISHDDNQSAFQYCWEFHSKSGKKQEMVLSMGHYIPERFIIVIYRIKEKVT